MNISIDFNGTYTEHKIFFDEMAKSMQKSGHKVGIITGERETKRKEIEEALGFAPDFMRLWGEFETIANGNLWKAERLDEEDVLVHFDDDAKELKRYTGRWIIKTLNSGEVNKF